MAKKSTKSRTSKAADTATGKTVKVNLRRSYRDVDGKSYGPGLDVEVPATSTIATFGVDAKDVT